MDAVLETGQELGWDEDRLRKEYFTVPEHDAYENFEFAVKLAKSDLTITVSADETLSDALRRNHIVVETKCEDGLCGVCSTPYVHGDIEHRDFVLSGKERTSRIIVCCSRAQPDGEPLVLDI